MLSRLSVKNFRLLRDVTIDVEPGKPIVLIGPNGVGKSSVIQVLDLLGRAARDGLRPALQAFGGGRAVLSAMAPGESLPELTVDVGVDVLNDTHWYRANPAYALDYSMRLAMVFLGGLGVQTEILRTRFPDGSGSTVSRNTESLSVVGTGQEEPRPLPAGVGEKLAFERLGIDVPYALSPLQDALASIGVYDGFLTTPLWARDLREGQLSPFDSKILEPCPRIDRRGLDLVNALHYLQSSHPDEWDDLERAFKAEFPFVQRLEFPADPAGGRIALGWRDRRHPGVRMQGHQMSEGMATYLCLLAAILTPDPAVAIAFDEPDRHLHPSALARVVELLERLSERTAVFVATHSDRLLDHLSDPAGSVRVCEPTEDGVAIHPLNREALDAWRAKFTLSELRRRGHLDPENSSAVEP